jgi:hypothetical protein
MKESSTLDTQKSNIKFLLNQLTDAHDFYMGIIGIYTICSDDRKRKKMNKAPGFFTIALKALWSGLYMTLARIYEKNDESINFIKVLNGCQSDPNFPKVYNGPDFINCNTGECVSQPPIPFNITKFRQNTLNDLEKLNYKDKLLSLRDLKYAHNDKKSLLCSIDYVSTKEALELIEFASNVLNQLLVVICGESFCIDSFNNDDLGYLFT